MDEVELMQNTEYVNVKWQCTLSNDTILRNTHFIDWIHAEVLWIENHTSHRLDAC